MKKIILFIIIAFIVVMSSAIFCAIEGVVYGHEACFPGVKASILYDAIDCGRYIEEKSEVKYFGLCKFFHPYEWKFYACIWHTEGYFKYYCFTKDDAMELQQSSNQRFRKLGKEIIIKLEKMQ